MKNFLKWCQTRRPGDPSANAPNPSEFEEVKHYHGTQMPHHVRTISIQMESWDADPTPCESHLSPDAHEDSERTWELQLQYDCQVSFGIYFCGKERLVPRQTLLVLPIYGQHGLVVYVVRDCCSELWVQKVEFTLSPVDNMLLPLVQENPFLVCFKYILFICSFAFSGSPPHISP